MKVNRGDRVPTSPDLSVVVMSIDSDPMALNALQTLEGQDIEKILVNTGNGSFEGNNGLEDVVLIEDDEKRLPGGTRNLGLNQARAPIIAFLAADCVMPRETLEKRIIAHRAGYHLVSSSLRPFSDSLASWASYIYIHKNRMPEFQKKRSASLFGVSYLRDVFDKVGYFDETMRVSEDAEFNRRCEDFPALIANDILTYHRYPETLVTACEDAARRAVREMKFRNRSGLRQAKSELIKSLRLFVTMLVTANMPHNARRAAIYLPLLGLSAVIACLRTSRPTNG